MEIISRLFAVDRHLLRYFTGKACKHGHISERYVSTCQCVECGVAHNQRYHRDHYEKVVKKRGVREEAIACGEDRYFTGRPCKHGHLGDRYTQSRQCVECTRAYGTEFHKEYYKNNKVRINKRSSDWIKEFRAKFPEVATERNKLKGHRRRARKAKVGGRHTAKDLREIKISQNGKCAICAVMLTRGNTTIDHIVPLTRGGNNGRRNIQLLCRPCNSSKGGRDPILHMQSRGMLL